MAVDAEERSTSRVMLMLSAAIPVPLKTISPASTATWIPSASVFVINVAGVAGSAAVNVNVTTLSVKEQSEKV